MQNDADCEHQGRPVVPCPAQRHAQEGADGEQRDRVPRERVQKVAAALGQQRDEPEPGEELRVRRVGKEESVVDEGEGLPQDERQQAEPVARVPGPPDASRPGDVGDGRREQPDQVHPVEEREPREPDHLAEAARVVGPQILEK
jgi:hypothetical protein